MKDFLTILRSLWHLFYKTAIISANNPIGQRNHSWLKVFNVPIHEIFRSSTKVESKREKLVRFEVIVIFGRNSCVFFFITKFRLFPKKAFLKTNLFLVGRLWNSKPPRFSKVTQKLHEVFKIWNFFGFVYLGQNLMHFSNTKCFYLLKKTTTTTNLFLTQRLQHSKPPSFFRFRVFWTFLVTKIFKIWTQTSGKTTSLKYFWCKAL